ncbi:MAG TPA: hypothetical protein DDX39_01735 [Bacteroidales bacterium]|nr:MAG: hypothetical protein A2W98_07950 [Bacteroidetes bacterium GWF2_33_38]OFY88336.1 MAG: hypothetical protein A2236_01005 [Bacteroidetes bacterium RIFOXYA2_FULL_33_7]HBF87333.1 hypothetical protein [Bacteroidales bacterium]
MRIIFFIFAFFVSSFLFSQNTSVKFGLLKYSGGGDWYANPTSLPNLIEFCNKELQSNIFLDYMTVEPSSTEIFEYPFVHMTGHGNVIFSSNDVENLRNYLMAGGFLHIDDNYGLDVYARREMKKVFPDKEFVEIPFNHPIYHQKYDFQNGLPKIHEHDNKAPQGFGIFIENRLVCFYSYECDLGDGWEDADVHGDSNQIRLDALKMGANIISYVFEN